MKRGQNTPNVAPWSQISDTPKEVRDTSSDSAETMVSNLDELIVNNRSTTASSLIEASDSGSSTSSQMMNALESPLIAEKEELRVLIYTPCYNVIDG